LEWLSFLRYILLRLLEEHGVAQVAQAIGAAASFRDNDRAQRLVAPTTSTLGAEDGQAKDIQAGVALLNALLSTVLFRDAVESPPQLVVESATAPPLRRHTDPTMLVAAPRRDAPSPRLLLAILIDVCAPHAAYRLSFSFSRFLQAHAVFRYEVLNAMHYVQSLGGGWASVRRPKQSQACARLLACLGALVGDEATVRKCQVFEGYALMWRGRTTESARVFRRAQRAAAAADDEVNYWRGHSGLRWLGYWLEGQWRREGGMGDLVQPQPKQRFL
jgi:hypothetical protein